MQETARRTVDMPAPARVRDKEGPAAALHTTPASNKDGQDLLQSLHQAVRECADQQLASNRQGADDCPYIAAWFARHAGDTEAQLRAAAHRYAPRSAGARNDADFIALVVDRVRQGLQANLATGSLSGVPAGLTPAPGATKPPRAPASAVAQLCPAPDEPQEDVLANAGLRERNFLRNQTLDNLNLWYRQIQIDVGSGFARLPREQKTRVTQAYERVTSHRRRLEAGERRARAQQLNHTLGQVDTSSTLLGAPDNNIIRDYTNPDTGRAEAFFNKPLRELDASVEQERAIIGLQNSLLQSPVHAGGNLWRGTGHLIGGGNPLTLAPGDISREPGFLSTSIKRSIAEGFKGDKGYLIKIRKHKSGREIISLGGDEYGGGEEEILFPAGASFRFIEYDRSDDCYVYDEA